MIIYFAPFHASLRHVQTCQLQKQTNPAKTGLVRCLVSKSHGSEFCNCRVQRVFFLSWQDHNNRSFATKRKPSQSGTFNFRDTKINCSVFISFRSLYAHLSYHKTILQRLLLFCKIHTNSASSENLCCSPILRFSMFSFSVAESSS